MEGSTKIDPNSSSSEVVKEALYGGYTRFELELEVPFHHSCYTNAFTTAYLLHLSLSNLLRTLTT